MDERQRRQLFTDIWKHDLWGCGSGPGSSPEFALPYAAALAPLIAEAVVVDIGCGDFRVGKHLRCKEYIGIDTVPGLVEVLQRESSSTSATFICGDALTMALPSGDVCLVRQVLQHLSNANVRELVENLMSRYALVIATDEARGIGNDDKPTDGGIRANGLYLEHAPFHYSVEQIVCVNGRTGGDSRSMVRTVRIGRL